MVATRILFSSSLSEQGVTIEGKPALEMVRELAKNLMRDFPHHNPWADSERKQPIVSLVPVQGVRIRIYAFVSFVRQVHTYRSKWVCGNSLIAVYASRCCGGWCKG